MPRDRVWPDRGPDGAVEAEQTRLLLQNPIGVPANLINAGLVGVIVWPLYPAGVLSLWLGLFCVVSLHRSMLSQRYDGATGSAKTSPNWARVFTLNAFALGCLWGLSASVILMTPDPIYYNFIVFVLGGMMAGSIVCFAANLRAMLAFMLPTILPAIVALVVHGGLVQIDMAVMLALFTCALVWAGRSINRSIAENVRLRLGQERLVASLRSSEAAMDASQALAHVGTWAIDLQSKSDAWSAETYRIFGVDPATFRPSFEALLARIHPDDRKAASEDHATLLESGTNHGIDHRVVMDDGSIKYVHQLGRAIHDANGRIVKVTGCVQDVTERRQREAASESLAGIVDASVDAIYAESVAGTILSWNKGAEHLFGYRADEAIGQSIRMMIPEDRREESDRNLAALANGQRIDPFDTERLRKDGTRVPVSIAVSLTRDTARGVAGASFVARDITERQLAAAALAYRDRLLHAVTVGSGTLVKARSIDLGMPEALRVVGRGMGVDRVLVVQAIAGQGPPMALRHCWEVADIQVPITGTRFPVDALGPAVVANWLGSLNDGQPVIAQLATSEGPIRELLERLRNKSTILVPIFVTDMFWGALGVDSCTTAREWNASEIDTLRTFADIAGAIIQHSEAQHSLETSEARFRAVTATAQDAIITIDGAARIGLWNAAAERILGYTPEEATGKHVHDLLVPSRFREKAKSAMEAFLVTGTGDSVGKTTELAALRRDGTEIAVELSLAAARLGDSWGAIGILRDITERKKVEGKLEFANVLLKSAMEASPDGILVVDPGRKIVLFNQRFANIWKIPPAELSNGTLETALLQAQPLMPDPANFIARTNHLFDHPGESSREQHVLTDGRIIDREIVTLSSGSGEYLGRVWYFRDITERRKADDRLAFANLLFRTQMEASLDGIVIVNENNAVVGFNQRFATIWNIPPADLAAGADTPVLAKVASSVKDKQNFIARVRYLYDHPGEDSQDDLETTDGRSIDRYTVTLYGPSRAYLGRAWFFRDITERKRVEALARRMARYDVLTGLANRAVFVEALQHAIATAKRGERSFAVLYLDLDHFKDVNDTLGHPVGDELLKAVADRLASNTRETDTVARFGGDEFAIVVADIRDPADAANLADKLLIAFAIPFSVQGSDIHSGASIGIAVYGSEASDAETLLSHADVALYRAKSEGRGGYRFFTDAMDAEVQTRVTLGAELRIAIDEGQLFLMYQPQVAIDTGRITGVEALVRWRHPIRGVLGPGVFIPIAEQIGIIAKLGHWVLWEACRQGRAWLDDGVAPIRISVNVSALQFRTPIVLEADIAAALAQTGLPPRMLELELTESVLMDASREHSDLLRRLRETGVTVAIDDFGTGYSSLDYLRRFPSNRIKIAQNFVSSLETTPGDAAIIRATIGLARELNIEVIAEGVETQVQRDLLKEWGCGEVQGYLFAKPLTADDAGAALRDAKISPPQVGTVKVGKV
jgi:diguanylate cyclase (GGDEF)-like protein/PAS domain S-box-containing protein